MSTSEEKMESSKKDESLKVINENRNEIKQRYICFKRTKEGDDILVDVVSTFEQVVDYVKPWMIYKDLDQMVRIMTYDAYKQWNSFKETKKEENTPQDSGLVCEIESCKLSADIMVRLDSENRKFYCNTHFCKNYYLEFNGGLDSERWNGIEWQSYTTCKRYHEKVTIQ